MSGETKSERKQRVLFVCLGNICRSPAAEGVFQMLVVDRNLSDKFDVDSAGTSNYHTGKMADPRMRSAAAKRGYALTSRARSFERNDLKHFDLIVAMDRENYRQIHGFATDDARNVCLLSDFLGPPWPKDVPDPYYGESDGFEYVLDMLEAACPKILERLTDRATFSESS
jgi:protein-tyrosine phosphatase